MTLGEIECKALVFRTSAFTVTFYVVGRDDKMGYELCNLYHKPDANFKKAQAYNMGENYERFFLLAVADCYSPPVVIIRAANEEDALGEFVDNFDWAHISEDDLEDYRLPDADENKGKWGLEGPVMEGDEYEGVDWNSNGQPYSTEGIHMQEVKLVLVETE